MPPPSNPPKSHLKQPHSPQSIKTGDESHPLIDQSPMAVEPWSSPVSEALRSSPSPLPHQPPFSMDPALTPAPTVFILLIIEMSEFSGLNTWHGDSLTTAHCHRHCKCDAFQLFTPFCKYDIQNVRPPCFHPSLVWITTKSKSVCEIIVNTDHLDLVIKWDLLMAADYC